MSAPVDFTSLLVKRLKSRDTSALDYIYDHYSAALYGIIYRTIPNQQLAEETLHDVFLKIWEQIDRYDERKGALFTWMYRIARNKSIDVRRSKDFKLQEKSDDITDYVNMFESQGQGEDAIGLSRVLDGLEEMCKKLIQLNFFMGYTHAEISKEERIPLGTVKTRLRKCLIQIRKQLATDLE